MSLTNMFLSFFKINIRSVLLGFKSFVIKILNSILLRLLFDDFSYFYRRWVYFRYLYHTEFIIVSDEIIIFYFIILK